MVAHAFVNRGGVVFLVLLDCVDLRCAGLARAHILRAEETGGRCAFHVHPNHAALDDIQILGQQWQLSDWLFGHWRRDLGFDVHHFAHQMRLHLQAVVGHRAHGMGDLQHGEAVVALTNSQGNGFAGIPSLLFGLFVGGALPLGRRQHAARLTQDVNARDLPKAQGLHLVVHQIHAHITRQRIVVGVTRLHDGLVHVHRTMTALFVVTKTVIAEHEETGVRDDRLLAALARL